MLYAGAVTGGRAQFGVGGMYPWISTYEWADISRFYSFGSVSCLTPRPQLKQHWIIVFLPLSAGLWAAVISMFVFVSVLGSVFASISAKHMGKCITNY